PEKTAKAPAGGTAVGPRSAGDPERDSAASAQPRTRRDAVCARSRGSYPRSPRPALAPEADRAAAGTFSPPPLALRAAWRKSDVIAPANRGNTGGRQAASVSFPPL